MLFPQEFVLHRSIRAIELFEGPQTPGRLVHIPRYSVVCAECASARDGMVEIRWQDQRYAVFEQDLEERGDRYQSQELRKHTA
jgi:hypothetical protein